MKHRTSRFVFGVALLFALAATFPSERQYAQGVKGRIKKLNLDQHNHADLNGGSANDSPVKGYTIVRSAEGASCRQSSLIEARQLRMGERTVSVRVLKTPGSEKFQQTQQGLKIQLRGTTQLDQTPAARDAFLRAAAKWEAIIKDPITVIIDVDYGPNRFGTPYPSPDIIGSTDAQDLIFEDGYMPVRVLMQMRATDPLQAAAIGALPLTSLPTDLGGTAVIGATSATFRGLGLLDPVPDPIQEEADGLGTPPSIGFNSSFDFDFDPRDGIDANKIDFEGAAVHEIGHAIGFGSNVGIKELIPTFPITPTVWDFFRFRPGGLNFTAVTSQSRLQLAGGQQTYFAGDGEVALSTSDPLGGGGGDGRQASHWKDDALIGSFLGIMDPTAISGVADNITAADVYATQLFGYTVNPDVQVTELLSVDDYRGEENLSTANALYVNRFTPARYPSTLQSIRIRFPATGDFTGQPLRVFAFVDANRTGQPTANPTFIADQTLTVPALSAVRFVDIAIPTPPTITAGDLYIGVQSSSATVSFLADNNGRQAGASFVSIDNGASFQPLQGAGGVPVNLIVRATISNRFGATPTPAAFALSPSAVAPGSGDLTLTVRGSGFRPTSVVQLNGAARTTTFVSGSELRAAIPAADVTTAGTAAVTVNTPSGGLSTGLTLTVTNDNPAPALARVFPAAAAVGAAAAPVNVFGGNFTAASVIQVNGTPLPTALVNSQQLTAEIPGASLTAPGALNLTVTTPGPGGGTTTPLPFTVVACAYTLSATTATGSSFGGSLGVVLNTSSPCAFTATPNQPWITVDNPPAGSGTGKFVLNYSIGPNTDITPRTGALAIAGQTLNIRQIGRATAVSAASYLGPNPLAASTITSIFGGGLANASLNAPSIPLPIDLGGTRISVVDANGLSRSAPLFATTPGQVNFLVPAGTAVGPANIVVRLNNLAVADGRSPIAATGPGLFAASANGSGVASAVVVRIKADGSQVFEPAVVLDQGQFKAVPIDLGPATERVFLVLFGTGIRGRATLADVKLTIGDAAAPVSFAGPQGLDGLDQLNAEIPRSLIGRGEVTVTLGIGTVNANPVKVSIK